MADFIVFYYDPAAKTVHAVCCEHKKKPSRSALSAANRQLQAMQKTAVSFLIQVLSRSPGAIPLETIKVYSWILSIQNIPNCVPPNSRVLPLGASAGEVDFARLLDEKASVQSYHLTAKG